MSQSRRRWPHVICEIENSITLPPTAHYFRQCAHRTHGINYNYIMLDTENSFDLAMVSREEIICLWPQTDIFRYSCSLLILTYSEISKNELLDNFQIVIFLTKLVQYSHKFPVIFALFEILIPIIYKHRIRLRTSHQRMIFQSLFASCFNYRFYTIPAKLRCRLTSTRGTNRKSRQNI
jgi:hypothetical protein